MPFNETQQYVYQISSDFLVDKLDAILEKSKQSQSALNAACFLLHVTLKDDQSTVNKIADILYPEEKYLLVKNIFLEIHGLLNGKRPNHSLIKSVTDPRFFSSTLGRSDYLLELHQTIARSLKDDLDKWLLQKYEANVVSPQTIAYLEEYYSSDRLSGLASRAT